MIQYRRGEIFYLVIFVFLYPTYFFLYYVIESQFLKIICFVVIYILVAKILFLYIYIYIKLYKGWGRAGPYRAPRDRDGER